MIRYVALLRGINVSGQKLIKMEELRKHFELPGFANITSYIQSGNILFDTKEKKQEFIRTKIEEQLLLKLGYAVPVIVRSLPDLEKVIAGNPFNQSELAGAGKLYVHFLSAVPAADKVAELDNLSSEMEQLKIRNREAYLLTGSYGTTRFSNTFIEKKLAVQSTARNWNTVNKLLAL